MRKVLIFLMTGFLFAGIHVGKNEVKRGDVVCIGDTAVVEGEVKGDLVAIACTLHFSGKVKGDLISIASKVYGKEGAEVNEDMVFIVSSGCIKEIKVKGSLVKIFSSVGIKSVEMPFRKNIPKITITPTRGTRFFHTGKFFLGLIFWIVLSLFTLLLFEKRVLLASSALSSNMGRSWVRGFLLLLLFIFLLLLFVILSFILIGIPFLLLLVFLLLAAMVFGYTVVFHLVGKSILSSQTSSHVYYVLLGAVLFSFLNAVFLVKDLISLVIFPIALGITHITRFGKRAG